MGTSAQFIVKDLEKDLYYVSICHGNGYPSETYPILEECYNSFSKALRLSKISEFESLEGPIAWLDIFEDGKKSRIITKSTLTSSKNFTDYYYYFIDGKWIWFSSVASLRAYMMKGELTELEDFFNYYVDSTCEFLGGDLCLDEYEDKKSWEYKLSKCLLSSDKFKNYFLGYVKTCDEDSYFDDTYLNFFYKKYIKKNAEKIADIIRYRILKKLKSGREVINNEKE